MSKTDLRIRPIYHRIRDRIEAHICISFTAYCVYKKLERVLEEENSILSVKQAAELTHNMYQITYTLPELKHTKSKLLKMDDKQAELYNLIQEKFQGVPMTKTRKQETRGCWSCTAYQKTPGLSNPGVFCWGWLRFA